MNSIRVCWSFWRPLWGSLRWVLMFQISLGAFFGRRFQLQQWFVTILYEIEGSNYYKKELPEGFWILLEWWTFCIQGRCSRSSFVCFSSFKWCCSMYQFFQSITLCHCHNVLAFDSQFKPMIGLLLAVNLC